MPIKPEQLADRIVKDPQIPLGKPTVRGTRIPVDLVLEHLAYNPDFTELFAAYRRLTVDDVKACLAYASRVVRRGARKNVTANRPPAAP